MVGLFGIDSLQPLISLGGPAQLVWANFYPGLLRDNPDTGALEPGLAEQFGLSPDGLTATFTLRDGLAWNDGVPFTGEDFKYTVEALARSKKATRTGDFRDVVGFEDYAAGRADTIGGITVGNSGRTIAIKLANVSCPALRHLAGAGGGVLPRHHFLKAWNNSTTDTSTSIDDHPLNDAPPASMGPFVFSYDRPGVDITMVPNDRYYRGRPLVDECVAKLYAGPPAIAAAMLAGEIHAGFLGPAADQVRSANSPLVTVHPPQTGVDSYLFIGWNQKAPRAPWLAVKEVRQALWYGLNVQAMLDKIAFGLGHRVYAHTPQASWAYDGTRLNRYDYDPARARQLLEGAGATMGAEGIYVWTNGQPMQMRIEAPPPLATHLEVATEQYATIGLKIDPRVLPAPALFERIDPTNLDREGTILPQELSPDPDAFAVWHSSQTGPRQLNRFHYSSPVVDRALESGRDGPDCSPQARRNAYATMDRQLNEDAPVTFLFTPDVAGLSNRSLQNSQPKPYSFFSLWNIEQWWLSP